MLGLRASGKWRWWWGVVPLMVVVPALGQEDTAASDVPATVRAQAGVHESLVEGVERVGEPESVRPQSGPEEKTEVKPKELSVEPKPVRSARPSSPRWDYSGERGPERWAKLSRQYFWCGLGKNQSPIDIRLEEVLTTDLRAIEFHYLALDTWLRVENSLVTARPLVPKATIQVEQRRFTLETVQFHTPSEHTDGGNHYPLEAQLIHRDKEGNPAVVAIWFRPGQANPLLDEILAATKQKNGSKRPIDWSKILPPSADYYRYNGSLTTPPCSEGVRWYVMSEAVEASEEQLRSFRALTGKNNRPVQPLNARRVLE